MNHFYIFLPSLFVYVNDNLRSGLDFMLNRLHELNFESLRKEEITFIQEITYFLDKLSEERNS